MKIKINDRKIEDLLREKNDLVEEGRSVSRMLEGLDKLIQKNLDKQRAITSQIEPEDIKKRGEEAVKIYNEAVLNLDKVTNEMTQAKLAGLPDDVRNEYNDLQKRKEGMEKQRNKIALKVQKIKDRVVPAIQKKVVPLLKDFEDIDTAELIKGNIVVETHNLLTPKIEALEKWKTEYSQKMKSIV